MDRTDLCPQELEDRLIEWARCFRDRRSFTRCASMERLYNRNMPGAWDGGWGDPGAPERALPPILVPRAVQTNEAIVGLGGDSTAKVYKWSITYHYCFPGLERSTILKGIRRMTGRRLNWRQFGEALDIARVRVWTTLNSGLRA